MYFSQLQHYSNNLDACSLVEIAAECVQPHLHSVPVLIFVLYSSGNL